MGNKSSKSKQKVSSSKVNQQCIGNHFESWEQLIDALRKYGLESSNLLVAIDFTKSNTWQGERTFRNKCLHHLEQQTPPAYSPQSEIGIQIATYQNYSYNPYEYVISTVANVLNPFDDDGWIPTIIFGHARNNNESYVKPIYQDQRGSYKLEGVLNDYRLAVQNNPLSGPTSFSPVIDWAVETVKKEGGYHILLIIGDGCVNSENVNSTVRSIQKASKYPLSIIFIGVGDGDSPNEQDNWKLMRQFDDDIPNRDIDNWQSVYLSEVMNTYKNTPDKIDIELATMCLMEVPFQFKYFREKGMI